MNTTAGARPPHLGDEELLRWIDRQLDLEHSRRARGHLSACEACTERLDALRERSRVVSAWIGEIPVQLPDPGRRALALAAVERARTRRRRRPTGIVGSTLRVAAMVMVLLGATLGTSAGRTWMGDRVQQAVGRDPGPVGSAILRALGRDPERQALAARAPTPGADASAAVPGAPPGAPRTLEEARSAKSPPRDAGPPPVAFAPAGREVVLVFDHVQERGVASLVIRNVPEASIRATGTVRGEKLVVTDRGLAVRNERASRADYSIVIPTRYRLVRVRIAKQPDRVLSGGPAKREWLWSIPLNESALR